MADRKNLIYITLSVVAVIFFGYFFFRDTEVKMPPPKNFTVVAFGDSLVEGVGASAGQDFVSLLGQRLGIPIINEGRSGDTTESALQRVAGVIARDPGVVIILLGGNDYLRRVPKSETFANLGKIVDAFKANGTIVLLLGVRGGLLRDTYESDFKNFAKKKGLVYVPNVLNGIIGNRELMSDEIHPNDKGYQKVASLVEPYLRRILNGR